MEYLVQQLQPEAAHRVRLLRDRRVNGSGRRNVPVPRLPYNGFHAEKAMTTARDPLSTVAGQNLEDAPAGGSSSALPEHINQMVRGYWHNRCLLTALELDIFTAVGSGTTAERVASSIQCNARSTAMLLNALVALGLLSMQDGIYENSAESARYFDGGSKDNCREGLLHMANVWHNWSNLTEAVRLGTCIQTSGASSPAWTENFIAGMQLNAKDRAPAVVQAIGIEGVRRVLDLGGGSGIYSISFAKASSAIRCQILDLPQVVPITARYVERAGFASQIEIRPGNMHNDDLGSGFDLVMLNAICHIFSPDQNQQLFRRIRQALAPGGRLVVQDFILNPDKTGPLHAAMFSLNMLVGTESGATYSEPEYTSWMTAAGFDYVHRINLPGPASFIIGRAA